MKSHRKKPAVRRRVVTEGNVEINFNAVSNLDWKFLMSPLMTCLEEFYADPANAALAEKMTYEGGQAS